MPALASAGLLAKGWRYLHRLMCGAVLLLRIAPILAIILLLFNSVSFFTYPMPGMSRLWYEEFLTGRWLCALHNSIFVAVLVTLLSTALGTSAALWLSRLKVSCRKAVMSVLISPMIIPAVINAVAVYFGHADIELLNSYIALVLAHTTLATSLVVIAVTATLMGLDHSLTRAATGLGAPPVTFEIILPPIIPGMTSGALFACLASFDEVVVAPSVGSANQRTLPTCGHVLRIVKNSVRPLLLP
ncbi:MULTISPECIES: ABC transporter permease [unclassified Bradyrhizobium]|uniref:ABC transporter permease n=1 Tax=unclassified Bradyrhizobium TaxID=2631580 RepID=UPI001CD3F33E|nr:MULTISPECIES: ABC transporter permease [unclassified Bradyrhizobium]